MMISFKCEYDGIVWQNNLELISITDSQCEFSLKYNGNHVNVLIGKSRLTNWICVPLMKIGLELSYFNDVFWNRSNLLRETDQITSEAISQAIKILWEKKIIA